MFHAWIWGSLVIFLLAYGGLKAWEQLINNNYKYSLPTWLALVVLFFGLGMQCSNNISLISSVGMLLLPMAFVLITMIQIINLKLKTPIIILLGNPLCLLLIAIGFRLLEGVSRDDMQHKELDTLLASHIFLVMLSFIVIFLSVLVSVVLLIQDLKLKRKLRFKISLPSLDLLERIVRTLNNVALLLLTGAIGAGDLYGKAHSPEQWQSSTVYWTMGTWVLLATLSLLHFTNRISGQRFAWGNFLVALAALIALLGHSHGMGN